MNESEAADHKREMQASGLHHAQEFAQSDSSFSGRVTHEITGEDVFRVIHVSPSDLDDDCQIMGLDIDRNEHEYFIALHELAHMILRHKGGQCKTQEEQAQEEIDAWHWALSHAQYWPSDECICAMLNACSTYTHLSDELKKREIKLIQRDLPKLKEAYEKAVASGAKQFTLDGEELVTKFAKYLIEFLDKKLIDALQSPESKEESSAWKEAAYKAYIVEHAQEKAQQVRLVRRVLQQLEQENKQQQNKQ